MKEKRLIITIGRQYGSGGSEIGTKLAKELGLGFYDKNILRMNAANRIVSGLPPEQKLPSFGSDLISADNLFRFQSEVIKKLAAEENCVILGRCADYVLDGTEGLVRIFLYADMDARIRRITEKGYYEPKDVKKNIKRVDRERREYHLYYTGKDWESPENYDLMLNTGSLGIENCISVIKHYLETQGYSCFPAFTRS